MVKQKKLPIRWDKQAKTHLDDIYNYIAKDSVYAARYVKKELIKLAGSLNDFPNKYSKEEYLACPIHKILICYKNKAEPVPPRRY